MSGTPDPGARRTARLAGALYLLMMPFAIFTLYVRGSKIVGDDPAATASNILAAPNLYRLAIVTWLTSQVISVFLVIQLHKLLKPVNATQALLMLALALLGVPVVFANESHSFAVLVLLQDPLLSANIEQLASQLMLHLRLHERGIAVAHVFWGLWLLPLGWLVFRSGYIASWLGVLLLIAGAGYLFDFFTKLFAPGLNLTVTPFTFLGELLLPLWLLIKGVDPRRAAADPPPTPI
jgi:hypothetical protein